MVGMATSTGFPFVLTLLLFFLVSCSLTSPTTSSTHVPLTVSAKATAVQYWNRVVGGNSHPPSVLLSHLPNISPLDLITYLNEFGAVSGDGARDHATSGGDFKYYDNIRMVRGEDAKKKGDVTFNYRSSDDNHAGSDSPDPTSRSGHNRAADADMSRVAGVDAKENFWFRYDRGSDVNHDADIRRATFLYIYDSSDPSSRSGRHRDYKQRQSTSHNVGQGIFFRESQLKRGTTMPVADMGGEMPHQNFLPRDIASKIRLSADAVRKLFHIPADAPMGEAVAATIADCRQAPPEGETRRCITSAEDMIDYVASSLGAKSNITAHSTNNSNGLGGTVLIGEVKAVNGGKPGRVVACHQAAFPYLMYQCHNVPKTKLYDVEFLDPETKVKINLAPAICHFDTSAWSPSYAGFVALGYEPGMEVCHWIFSKGMAWTAAAAE